MGVGSYIILLFRILVLREEPDGGPCKKNSEENVEAVNATWGFTTRGQKAPFKNMSAKIFFTRFKIYQKY